MTEYENQVDSYQILACNITWNVKRKLPKTKVDELPVQIALDIPENVLNQARKRNNSFNDIIETFTYNLLTRKFGCEVASCQVWLPPEI